ncbi:MAG: Gfo/Idh/MocA family oxidoreductase [Candidatus Omnitrophica bacterium]|nr:Gfo/Idh/MocA family oxidoreductase [Candidatus Omnitrophota bacterium]
MKKERIRLALIGAGGMANSVHYPSLAEFPDVEMAGLCDLVEEKLIATSKKFHIKRTFADYKKMLDEIKPDAVYILMPPHHLFDLVIESLNRKLNVFIEKPPGITTEQTRNMARAAEKNDCLTMVGFQRRFCPVIVEARKKVEERGPIIQCAARFMKNYFAGPYYNGAVDILTSDAIHAVDVLRWMGGEVKKVSSDIENFYVKYDNAFNALLKFESGAVGMLLTNWVVGKRIFRVEMHAKGISAFAEPDDKALIYKNNEEKGEILLTAEVSKSKEIYKYAGFFAENRHFIDCLKKGKQPLTNFADSVKTMELVSKIYHSQI